MKEMISLKNKPLKAIQKSQPLLDKQNSHKQQKSPAPNPERTFGKDITKAQNNQYKFVLPKTYKTYVLPTSLQPRTNIAKALRPYEEDIISYVVDSHHRYDFQTKTKQQIPKSAKRPKIIEFYFGMTYKFKLNKKTPFLASYIYDRYQQIYGLSLPCDHTNFASACLHIAMKYEEIYPPYLKEWANNHDQIYKLEARILKALDFQLIFTSAQHYLELYLSKQPNQSKQKRIIYQSLLELYLISGAIYQDHPLKIVQEITDSFRPTIFMENDTRYLEIDRKIKNLIKKNTALWEKLTTTNIQYAKEIGL